MVPIRFSQHEHRILTGQKPYFKRVLPFHKKNPAKLSLAGQGSKFSAVGKHF